MNRTPCLMYHQTLGADEPLRTKWMVKLSTFTRQMDRLRELGFTSIDLRRERPFATPNGCLITFDDGHSSNLRAAEELTKRGLVGVFYVVKDLSLNDPEYLNEAQIRQISEMGHVIGIHGKAHVSWTSLPTERLLAEIGEMIGWLESVAGKPVITCSAPNGCVNGKLSKLIQTRFPQLMYVRNSYYASNEDGAIERGSMVNSVAVKSSTTADDFERIVRLDRAWYLKARTVFWIKELAKTVLRRS